MERDHTSANSTEPSRIEIEYGKDVTIVTFMEDKIADEEQIRELQEALGPVIEKNQNKQLILNFVNIRLVNSVLFNFLVRVRKKVHRLGGQLQLSNLDSNLRRIFEITELTNVFEMS